MRLWRPWRAWSLSVVVLGVVACGGGGDPPASDLDAAASAVDAATADIDGVAPVGDILDELRAIPGMSATEATTMLEGYRFFLLTYDQPVDHADPEGQRFPQRMTLLHRDYAAPMVVQNSGYNVSQRGGRSQVTALIAGNQLSMEHRYFEPSRPAPADWSKLTIEQAANDQHRITQALKARLYRGKWLTTGASKGGMTSLFHRRFFPDDVDATVAYVAPIDYPADGQPGPNNRYVTFLENVGTDPACRQKLKDFQNQVLARREAMKTRMRAAATYTEILGEDRALEAATVELPFIFWQYGRQSACAGIPGATATDDAVFRFFDNTIDVASYGDEGVLQFLPYYHQSATQLGYPADDESHLVGLQFPGGDTARAYIPTTIPTPAYDEGAAMRDVQAWIAASGERIMLIYGQNDPWSAGAVDLGNATDSFKFIAPGGNHGSSITSLTPDEETLATDTGRRWAGLPAMAHAGLDPAERSPQQDAHGLRPPPRPR